MELFDLYNAQNEALHSRATREETHRKGYWHRTVHLWLHDPEQGLLWQKRSSNKDTNPDFWDLSIAGHVSAGESLEEALAKEAYEEVGLTLDLNRIQSLGVLSQKFQDPKTGVLDAEHQYIYLLEGSWDLNNFTPQQEEVSELRYFAIESLIQWNAEWGQRVDHSKEYHLLHSVLSAAKLSSGETPKTSIKD